MTTDHEPAPDLASDTKDANDERTEADELLAVYLRDHLAGSNAGLGLAKRCRQSNEGSALGEVLAVIEAEIDEDRASLQAIMARLGVSESELKKALASTAEVVARLKTNSKLFSYSPSSRVVELEGLGAAVMAKRSLWRSLLTIAPQRPELDPIWLERLEQRATSQYDRLLVEHDRAAATAFGSAAR